MRPEELQAFEEITKNISKIVEFSKQRTKDTKEAIEKYNAVAKNFKTFQENWESFDMAILEGILEACDLANSENIIPLYYNLMFQMEENPIAPIVKYLYYDLAEEISARLEEANRAWAALMSKREHVTYDLMQKEMYLKAEYNYRDEKEGVNR